MKMVRFSAFLLLAALAFLHATEARSFQELISQVEEKANPYDKLTLVVSWAPGYCKKEACAIPTGAKKTWTIHGLWPFQSGSKVPPSCPGTYDKTLISSIRTEMTQKWPTYKKGGSNDVFWAHEYEKHGTCADDIAQFDNQKKYFDGTMNLYDKYDIKAILANGVNGANAVKPSSTLQYPLSYITSALKQGLGVDPAVYCVEKKTGQYLWEVRMCFDKSLNKITCGTALVGGGKCNPNKKVIYEPFP